MLTFLLGSLISLASAHEFLAESNIICSTCRHSVEHFVDGGNLETLPLCKTQKGVEYLPMCRELSNHIEEIKTLFQQDHDPFQICEHFQMCTSTPNEKYSSIPAIDINMVNEINSRTDIGWKAKYYPQFQDATLEDVRKMLGTVVDPRLRYPLPQRESSRQIPQLPTSFDARTQWPECAGVIGHIRDQSACGCCWAFGSTEAYNDRLCIATNGTFQQLLSTEDTCSCCNIVSCGSEGCNGGDPAAAWDWFTNTGIVSGGDYSDIGKTDTCDPYSLPPCAHHEPSSDYTPCPTTEYSTPPCVKSCSNTGYAVTFDNDKHYAKQAYSINGVESIMQEIYTYGTVTASFTVYEDFLTYESGVYVHTTGKEVGGHSIKILGWGVDNGQDYWLCANSWNDSWGENGYFLILKGSDECGIEREVCAGTAN